LNDPINFLKGNIMDDTTLGRSLNRLSAVNVLDVATGAGFFAETLKNNLNSWQTITGIDQKPFDEKTHALFTQPGMNYRQMPAEHLDFAAASFDLVAISNSLHHFPQPELVLAEMKRVLKPNGIFVIFEMFNDMKTAPQLNAVHLHQWWGKINTAKGIYHNPHYNRADIIALLENTLPACWQYTDIEPEGDDPFEPELMDFIKKNIEQYCGMARGLPDEGELIREGQSLLEAIRNQGHLSATELLAIGYTK
jgi:ubiquinone/menaquinone biosynthesis C-methylase UbiE